MSRWMLALPVIAFGVALSGSTAAGPTRSASTSTAPPDAEAPVQAPKPAKADAHRRHHFARHDAARQDSARQDSARQDRARRDFARQVNPERDPVSDTAAKGPSALALPPRTAGEGSLQPRGVGTVRITAAPEPPLEAPQAEVPAAPAAGAAADASAVPRLNADAALANLLALGDKLDDGATLPGAEDASLLPGSLTAIQLLMLFGLCGCAAVGCYGLVALNARRRKRGLAPSPNARRSPARPLPSLRDRQSESVPPQRLFPHQFGAAIRSQ